MKRILILITCLVIITLSLKSQTKAQELSNAEMFSAKSGTLISREFIDVGKVKTTLIKVVHYTDLIAKETLSAVRFEHVSLTKYSVDTKIGALDADEIDGLLKSLLIIKDEIITNVPENYTEVTFKSRGGFEAGCFYGKEGWALYLKLDKYDSKSNVFLSIEDLPVLLEQIEKAKSLIK